MSNGNIGFSEGHRSPAMITAELGHTYRWLKNGKSYKQVDTGVSNNWVEEGSGGSGGTTSPGLPDRSVQYNGNGAFEGNANFTYEEIGANTPITVGPLVIGEEYTIANLLGADVPSAIAPRPFFPAGTGYPVGTTIGLATATSGSGVGLTVDVTADAFGVVTNMVINNPGSGYSSTGIGGGDLIVALGGGNDAFYQITETIGGDDFLNVGAPSNSNGVTFIATDTTPTDWSNNSVLIYFVATGAQVNIENGGAKTDYLKLHNVNIVDLTASPLTLPHSWTMPNKSGMVSLLEDNGSSRTLWVDAAYGDNATAISYNRERPYRNVQTAINAAIAGDLVRVRPGDYLESIILKDGVNIYLEPNSTIGSTSGLGAISDNGVSVNCRITGFGTVDRRFNNDTFKFTGTNTVFYGEFYEVLGVGTKFNFRGNTSFAGDVHIKCVNVSGTQFNGHVYKPEGTSDANFLLEVSGIFTYVGGGSGNGVQLMSMAGPGNQGKYTMLINKLTVPNTNRANSGQLVVGASNEGPNSPIVHLEIETLDYQWDFAAPSSFWNGLIAQFGVMNWDVTFIVKNHFTSLRRPLVLLFGGTGTINISVNMTGNEFGPIIDDRGTTLQKLTIYDSILTKPNTGVDNNLMISSSGNGTYLELNNVILNKETLGGDGGALISLVGATSVTTIKDTEIYLTGPGLPASSVCAAPSVPEGEVYFKNTFSNIGNLINITDIALVPGFVGNDTNLKTSKI